MNAIQTGFWAGVLANGPMTMALMKLDENQREELPPAKLTADLTPLPRNDESRAALALAAHFAFSISTGIFYSCLIEKIRAPIYLKGAIFGVTVWAVSYLGWIPLTGSRAAANKLSARRNWEMFAVHLVWGLSLGLAAHQLTHKGKQKWSSGHGQAFCM